MKHTTVNAYARKCARSHYFQISFILFCFAFFTALPSFALAQCLSDADCNDNNACTTDRCDPLIGCTYEQVTCDDDDLCTLNQCDAANGCYYTPNACNDDVACTRDFCDQSTGICTNFFNCSLDPQSCCDDN